MDMDFLITHLILNSVFYSPLEKMAGIGNGSFQHRLDELQLAKSFDNLATSLKPNVVALI